METQTFIDDGQEGREARGRLIARSGRIRKVGRMWSVPSQSAGTTGYIVDLIDAKCTCPDFELRAVKCKHQHAVEYALIFEQSEAPDGSVTETVTVKRKTYPRNWPAISAAHTHEKDHVEELLHALCEGIQQPPQASGRPRKALRDVVYSIVHKVYTTLSGRRAQSDLRACRSRGHVEDAVSYNSVFRYMADPALTPILKALVEESALPLKFLEEELAQFAIDSTGFGTSTYARWFEEKYGEKTERLWVKFHAFVGTRTHVVTSCEVNPAGDCPMLPPLLATTAKNFDMKEVSGDKAYLSKDNVEKIHAVGATPYIPFKENSTGKGPELWRRMYAHFMLKRPEFLQHYHRRSNSETVFHMLKSTLGAAVRAKLPVAQANEVYAKAICHNLRCLVFAIYDSGLKPEFWTDRATAGETMVLQ